MKGFDFMRAISIKTQRTIMMIPIINVSTLFICIYNLHAVPIVRKNERKVLAYLFGYNFPVAIGYSVMYRLAENKMPTVAPLVYLLAIYIIPLIMSYSLIKFQEKYIFSR